MFVFCVLEKKTTKFKRRWWWWRKTRAHTENQKAFSSFSGVFFPLFFFGFKSLCNFFVVSLPVQDFFLSIIVARRRNYFFSWIFLTADHFLPYACFPIRSLSLSLSGTTTCLRKSVDLANLLRSLSIPRSLRTQSRSFGGNQQCAKLFRV